MAAEHTVKDLILRAQIPVKWGWKKIPAPPAAPDECPTPTQQNQLLRVLHGKQPKENLIDQREDGRVRADPQTDRKECDDCETSIPHQCAQPVSNVVHQIADHGSVLQDAVVVSIHLLN